MPGSVLRRGGFQRGNQDRVEECHPVVVCENDEPPSRWRQGSVIRRGDENFLPVRKPHLEGRERFGVKKFTDCRRCHPSTLPTEAGCVKPQRDGATQMILLTPVQPTDSAEGPAEHDHGGRTFSRRHGMDNMARLEITWRPAADHMSRSGNCVRGQLPIGSAMFQARWLPTPRPWRCRRG